MKNAIFTIVAKNYIGLAQILEKSIKEHFTDFDFHIVVADEYDGEMPSNAIIAKDALQIEQWDDMAFKYNLTEFCTSIKPASFQYFIQQYEKVIYLDPDIYFFSSIGLIFDMLDKCNILLTPHITQLAPNAISDAPENVWFSCGMFNLGFCGVKQSEATDKMLAWWHNRLVKDCFIDGYDFLFTDQKWMDFLPSFFTPQELNITRHLGMNAAPWNFFEREIFNKNGQLTVKPRNNSGDEFPLVFVHYSGYDYKELKKGSVIQNNIPQLASYKDIAVITEQYAKAISSQSETFDKFIAQTYSYNFYPSGETIDIVHRRLYRSLRVKGEEISINDFYILLKKHKMVVRGGVNLDKTTKNNLSGVGRKLILFNKLTRLVYRLMGYQKYMLLVRLLRPFSRYEAQIHLLDKKFDDKNIF